MIDEIELHLHPSWQRHAIETLPEVFPNPDYSSVFGFWLSGDKAVGFWPLSWVGVADFGGE
jgi:predicted ATP-binding protein involved in virulence